ncbi:DegT/DnrJ/EryC1/StrS family aminotransferase [Serratia fonticola]|uniref:DegT/DnrJ/EryC1/StrS family aminotransferase n=1 Tax=Serratia fonticola TaxID=47917 RepID=UPI003AAFF2A3
MKVKYLDLVSQYNSIETEINTAILNVVKSGHYCLGEQVFQFEKNFANFCNVSYAVACNSGTSALHMALLAAGIQEGDEVITTAATFVATVAAIRLSRAVPVLVDISDKTLNIDCEKIECLITDKTKAIIVVHLHGNPCEIDKIRNISRKHGLVLIEDAAQAHDSEYKGHRIGSIGDMACFSFYPGKNLGAYGEAGAVVTNNEVYAEKLKLIRDWGSTRKYEHNIEGYNYRMDAIQGAILDIKLKHLPLWTSARINKANLYKKNLSRLPVITSTVLPEAKHVYHVFAIRTERRNALKEFLTLNGIETGIHYPIPVHNQPAFELICKKSNYLKISEIAAEQLLSLPIYPELSNESILYTCQVIQKFFEEDR